MQTTEQTSKALSPREQTLNDYNVSHGRITSPGKFEGEPIFAPYYWNMALEGFSDDDNGTVFAFKFKTGSDDFTLWPELKQWLGRSRTLRLSESEQGFVRCF